LKHQIVFREVNGEEVIIMEGTKMSDMNTEEFFNATEEIRDFYSKIGCNIPEPVKDNFLANYINKQK
jgi:GTP-dependent phosphoenolpyruvate carboxykinase